MHTARFQPHPLVFVAWASIFCCQALAASPTFGTSQVGDTRVVLAYPQGYVDLCGKDKDAAELILPMVPETNRAVGCYSTADDYSEWINRVGGRFRSYLIASIMKASEGGKVSTGDFLAFHDSVRAQHKVMYQKLAPEIQSQIDIYAARVSAKSGLDIQTKLGEVLPIGVFDEAPNRFSSVWIAHAKHVTGDSTIDGSQVQISSAVLLKGRVFVLFTYGKYISPASIEQYKQIAAGWAAQFIDANR